MRNLKQALLSCAVAVLLGACAAPAPISVIGFNYEIDNARANGIVQVFDLSGDTVVHIRDMNPKSTQFLDAKNQPIVFKVVGENAVLSGMHSSFTVSTASAASRVIRKAGAPSTEPAAIMAPGMRPPSALPGATESEPAIVSEIARIRKELAELKTLLADAATRDARTPAAPVAAMEPSSSDHGEQSVVIVSFANNSRHFNPAQDQRTQLLALSHSPGTISVRGFTDSEFATPTSSALAKARAEAAKRYLISMGVSPAKIVVGFDGAGKFIAENRSPAGRAANRRVEIAGA